MSIRATPATADVLAVLMASEQPVWGLRVVKEAGRKAGTVYPILQRLESLGWIQSSWESDTTRRGPRRRFYEVTQAGAAQGQILIARARQPKKVTVATVRLVHS